MNNANDNENYFEKNLDLNLVLYLFQMLWAARPRAQHMLKILMNIEFSLICDDLWLLLNLLMQRWYGSIIFNLNQFDVSMENRFIFCYWN